MLHFTKIRILSRHYTFLNHYWTCIVNSSIIIKQQNLLRQNRKKQQQQKKSDLDMFSSNRYIFLIIMLYYSFSRGPWNFSLETNFFYNQTPFFQFWLFCNYVWFCPYNVKQFYKIFYLKTKLSQQKYLLFYVSMHICRKMPVGTWIFSYYFFGNISLFE